MRGEKRASRTPADERQEQAYLRLLCDHPAAACLAFDVPRVGTAGARNFDWAERSGPPRSMETSVQCLYQDGHCTQSISSDQTLSGVAAMSMLFCAKTFDDAGAYCGGQTMRESGICTFLVIDVLQS